MSTAKSDYARQLDKILQGTQDRADRAALLEGTQFGILDQFEEHFHALALSMGMSKKKADDWVKTVLIGRLANRRHPAG